MRLDLRFVDLEHEVHVQGDYIAMLAAHLPSIMDTERARIHALYDFLPPDERSWLALLERDHERGVPTRAFVAASIIGLWATYETSVGDVANIAKDRLNVNLGLDDLRGSFLERARRYFRDVLRFELHTRSADWPVLCDLAEVRHIFAHSAGRVRHLSQAKRERLLHLTGRHPGLAVHDHILVADTTAAAHFHAVVERSLADLFTRARAHF